MKGLVLKEILRLALCWGGGGGCWGSEIKNVLSMMMKLISTIKKIYPKSFYDGKVAL